MRGVVTEGASCNPTNAPSVMSRIRAMPPPPLHG
jgi:hypothetical protein